MIAEFTIAIIDSTGRTVDTYTEVRASDVESKTFGPAITLWMRRTMERGEAATKTKD